MPAADEVVLEPRPNTAPPAGLPVLSVTKEQLKAMSIPELVSMAWHYLGITLDPTQSKEKLVTKLLSMATDIRNV